MSTVHANPDDLQRFAKLVRETEKQIDDLKKKINTTMRSLDWDDPVKRRIDQSLSSILSSISTQSKQLDAQAREIEKKAQQLRVFLGR
jgi:L-lactate utilization protein LutC